MQTMIPTAWSVAKGIIWLQCNDPASAKDAARIKGARRVAYSVAGRYLRTFEMHRSLSWSQRWVARQMRINKALTQPIFPSGNSDFREAAMTRLAKQNAL